MRNILLTIASVLIVALALFGLDGVVAHYIPGLPLFANDRDPRIVVDALVLMGLIAFGAVVGIMVAAVHAALNHLCKGKEAA